MKKILMMLLMLAMLLALAACNGEEEETTPSTTIETVHTHRYSSTVTAEANCAEKGLEKFTCACGHTYSVEIPVAEHTWGDWETDIPALVEKDGTDKRICTACSASETRDSKLNATENSFADDGLQYVFSRWNGENSDISGYAMLSYFAYKYEWERDSLTVPSAEVFQWLSEHFALTDALKEEMKQADEDVLRYHADTDTFAIKPIKSLGSVTVLGYVHNSENRYTVYYRFDPAEGVGLEHCKGVWDVKVDYNLLNDQPNQYISAMKIRSIPDKVVS